MSGLDWSDDLLATLRRHADAVTPARVFTGSAGTSYPTALQLGLRADHAAARDAVGAALDVDAPPLAGLVRDLGMIVVSSAAGTRHEYLVNPAAGRSLSPAGRAVVAGDGTHGCDLQIVVGDGLSATAVVAQVPRVLPLLVQANAERLRVGRPIVVHRCRVGILNDVGEVLDPAVVVVLLGERPGLRVADSLSAYLGYRPRTGDTDARRNVVSNIHDRGTSPEQAVAAVLALVRRMIERGCSGVALDVALP